MGIDKFERYEISNVPEGVRISHWQALPRFGLGVIVLVILAACFLTDPYQGHSRIWAGLGALALALVALFGVKVESWTVSDVAIRHKSGLWNSDVLVERPPGAGLFARVEVAPSDSEGMPPAFRYFVHLIGPGDIEIGDGFRFRERSTMVRFLERLRESSAIEVIELDATRERIS